MARIIVPAFDSAWARRHIANTVALFFNVNIDLVKRVRGHTDHPGEFTITARDAASLKHEGGWRARIGGQMGTMSWVATMLGVKTFLHVANPTHEILSLLHPHTYVQTPHGFVQVKDMKRRDMSTRPPFYHFVKEYENDRVIYTHDPDVFSVAIDHNFFSSLEAHEKRHGPVDKFIVSGFHLASVQRIIDVGHLLSQLRRDFFFESGAFSSQVQRHACERAILPLCRCASMTYEEFCLHRHLSSVDTLIIHDPAYALAWKRQWKEEEQMHVAKALDFGIRCASYRAATGTFPRWDDFFKTDRFHPCAHVIEKIEAHALHSKRFEDLLDTAVIVPAREVRRTLTVGLGDTFAMGVFLVL